MAPQQKPNSSPTSQLLPKLTIITPVLNGVETLERAVQSIITQQYPNLEYIIIDGGSTDGTIEVVKKYEPHITKWISEKDSGTSEAINKGLNLANGEIIGLLLADDFYLEDAFEKVIEAVRKNPEADLFYGDMVYVGPLRPPFRVHSKPNVTKSDFYRQPAPVYLPAVFFRRTCFLEHGLFDTTYLICNDYELLLRFIAANLKFQHIDAALVSMQWGGSSSRPSNRTGEEFRSALLKYNPSPYTRLRFEVVWYSNWIKSLLKEWPVTKPLVQLYRTLRNRVAPPYYPSGTKN